MLKRLNPIEVAKSKTFNSGLLGGLNLNGIFYSSSVDTLESSYSCNTNVSLRGPIG